MQRVLLTALAALAPVAAHAEDAARATGLYLRGGGGVSFAQSLDQDLAWNPNVAFITAPATSKSTGLGDGAAYSAAIGFQYAKTRTELEYRHMEASVDGVVYSGGAAPLVLTVGQDVVAEALMSNVYFDFPNKSRLTPFIGVGVGGARIENEIGERDAAFAYQGRAGIEMALGGKFSIGAEYVYFRTMDVVYGPKDKEFTPTGPVGPRTDGDAFVSSSVMGTLRVLF